MKFEPLHFDSHLGTNTGFDSDSDSDYDSEVTPIQKCPILLSFFCLLVAEQEINLSYKTMSIGDVYTRLVKMFVQKIYNQKKYGI